MNKSAIILYYSTDTRTWGEILNEIQDVAYDVLSSQEYLEYYYKAQADEVECQVQDGILLNGDYYDWKEFTTKKMDIISSWLNYFSEDSLEKIYKALI